MIAHENEPLIRNERVMPHGDDNPSRWRTLLATWMFLACVLLVFAMNNCGDLYVGSWLAPHRRGVEEKPRNGTANKPRPSTLTCERWEVSEPQFTSSILHLQNVCLQGKKVGLLGVVNIGGSNTESFKPVASLNLDSLTPVAVHQSRQPLQWFQDAYHACDIRMLTMDSTRVLHFVPDAPVRAARPGSIVLVDRMFWPNLYHTIIDFLLPLKLNVDRLPKPVHVWFIVDIAYRPNTPKALEDYMSGVLEALFPGVEFHMGFPDADSWDCVAHVTLGVQATKTFTMSVPDFFTVPELFEPMQDISLTLRQHWHVNVFEKTESAGDSGTHPCSMLHMERSVSTGPYHRHLEASVLKHLQQAIDQKIPSQQCSSMSYNFATLSMEQQLQHLKGVTLLWGVSGAGFVQQLLLPPRSSIVVLDLAGFEIAEFMPWHASVAQYLGHDSYLWAAKSFSMSEFERHGHAERVAHLLQFAVARQRNRLPGSPSLHCELSNFDTVETMRCKSVPSVLDHHWPVRLQDVTDLRLFSHAAAKVEQTLSYCCRTTHASIFLLLFVPIVLLACTRCLSHLATCAGASRCPSTERV